MWCAMSEDDDITNLQEDNVHIHLSGVAFHVHCVGLGCHVVLVSDVLSFGFTTHTQFQVFFLMLWSDFILSSSTQTVTIIIACCTLRKRVL